MQHHTPFSDLAQGSLAYFAKGPLSRARSTFNLDLESELDMNDLIEFLKSFILTTVQVDKKYRETVPELVSKIKPTLDSSDEGPKKKRRTKNTKPVLDDNSDHTSL